MIYITGHKGDTDHFSGLHGITSVGWEGTLISTEEKLELVKSQADEDAFKDEFSKALADLMGKVRYRGIAHYEWIAEQLARSLAEEPALQEHLTARLPKLDQQEKESA